MSDLNLSIPAREAALLSLLDDPAPVVRTAVREALKALGRDGIDLLRGVVHAGEEPRARIARDLLEELVGPDPAEAFLRFIRSFNYELETGSLMLDRTYFPDLEVGASCTLLDRMAKRFGELVVPPSSGWEQCKVLNRVVFHEFGFRADNEAFINPRASFLSQVLETRRGMPLTLCLVYLLVAYRSGLDLEPISLPGRFMVGCWLDREPFYIDCYEHGVFRAAEDLREIFQDNGYPLSDDDLRPSPVGDVLQRACRNLVNQFRERGDFRRAAQYELFVHEFDDAHRRNARS
ncbi:MAG: transglutaminase-like domain-containing protein [Opitutales bacterium]